MVAHMSYNFRDRVLGSNLRYPSVYFTYCSIEAVCFKRLQQLQREILKRNLLLVFIYIYINRAHLYCTVIHCTILYNTYTVQHNLLCLLLRPLYTACCTGCMCGSVGIMGQLSRDWPI